MSSGRDMKQKRHFFFFLSFYGSREVVLFSTPITMKCGLQLPSCLPSPHFCYWQKTKQNQNTLNHIPFELQEHCRTTYFLLCLKDLLLPDNTEQGIKLNKKLPTIMLLKSIQIRNFLKIEHLPVEKNISYLFYSEAIFITFF